MTAAVLTVVAIVAAGQVDIFGHALVQRLPRGEPVLVILANKESQKEGSMMEAGPELFYRLRDVPYHTLVRVDLRGIPRFFHGVARSQLREAWRDTLRRYERVFERHGDEPPERLEGRVSFQADPDGRLAADEGLAEGQPGYLAVVLDGRGREVARGRLPQDLPRIEQAIRDAARSGLRVPAAAPVP